MRFIWFDMRANGSRRLIRDKFAPALEVWNPFIENCIRCYRPGENTALDERLFPTKARCPTVQYMANTPDKYGIKFWPAADAKSKYLPNGFPYLGKDEHWPADKLQVDYTVLCVMQPYVNKGQNVKTDNFFTPEKTPLRVEASWNKFCQNYKLSTERNSTFNKKCLGKFIWLSDLQKWCYASVYQGKVNEK